MPELKTKAATLNRRQWAMIALLAATLAGALYWPGDEAASPDAGQASAAAPAETVVARLPTRQPKTAPKSKTWPEIDLDAVLHHDPFRAPAIFAPDKADADVDEESAVRQGRQEADLLSLKQEGVSMVLRDASGLVAVIGERRLRIGDVVDGYRVLAIEMDGVVVERTESE